MKRVLALFLCTATVLFCAISANAHPGRTDSNGGHTDHSTGEYHYHHGYPAHDHYDLDGDGKADCPYEFKNQTDSSPAFQTGDSVSNTTTKDEDSATISWSHLLTEVIPGAAGALALLLIILSQFFFIFHEKTATTMLFIGIRILFFLAVYMLISILIILLL